MRIFSLTMSSFQEFDAQRCLYDIQRIVQHAIFVY